MRGEGEEEKETVQSRDAGIKQLTALPSAHLRESFTALLHVSTVRWHICGFGTKDFNAW